MFASPLTVNSKVPGPWRLVVLPFCFALSGFASIVYQIAWTRQFALMFGTTEAAVTLVLAACMAGLGLERLAGAQSGIRREPRGGRKR